MTISSELYSAILAMDAYSRGYDGNFATLSGNVDEQQDVGFARVVETSSFPLLRRLDGGFFVDREIGFYAVAYDTNADGFADVISYRGTNGDPLDVIHGWTLGLPGDHLASLQGQMAVAFYNEVANQADRPAGDITLVGHSLGGGLAGFVATLNRLPGFIYDTMEFGEAVESVAGNSAYSTFTYGNEAVEPTLRGIEGYFVNGEVLSIGNTFLPPFNEVNYRNADAKIDVLDGLDLSPLRFIPPSPVDLVEDLAAEALARHSQAALIIALFEREFYENTDLSATKELFWPLLFDDDFARSIGMDASNLGGALQTDGSYSDILRSVVAYSALDEGERPFGDTAIRALYDDASDLSDALGVTGAEGLHFQSIAPDLAKVFVNFAGQLARHDVEQSSVPGALDAVLDFQINSFGTRFSIDLSFDSSSLPYAANTSSLNDLRDSLVYQAALFASGSTAGETVTLGDVDIDTSGNADFGQIVYKILPGGNSTDTLSAPLGDGITLYIGADGGDRTTGSTGDDLIVGGADNDVYRGGSGNDTLIGGDGGDDVLRGGLDDDVYVFGSDWGNDFIDEEGGSDTILLTEHSFEDIRLQRNNGQNSLTIYMRNGDEDDRQDVPNQSISIPAQFSTQTDRIVEFLIDADGYKIDLTSGLQMRGTDNGGFSGGTGGSDYIETYDGDDVVYAYSGDDFIDGGADNDSLYGSLGSDTYIFEPGFGQDRVFDSGHSQSGSLTGVDPDTDNIDTLFFKDISPWEVRVEGSGTTFAGGVYRDMTVYVSNPLGGEDWVYVPRQFVNSNPSSAPIIERIEFSSGAWISTVRGVNENTLPTGVSEEFSSSFGERLTMSFSELLLNDSDLDPDTALSIVEVSPGIGGTPVMNDDTIDFIPDAGFSGTAQFTYFLADEFSAIPVDVFVDVSPAPNDAPVARDDGGAGFATDENRMFTTGNVLANDTDIDGDTLYVSTLDTSGTLGLVTDNGDGTFDYDPNGAFSSLMQGEVATDTFGYFVSDGLEAVRAEVTIILTAETPSLAVDDAITITSGTQTQIDLLANDTVGDRASAMTLVSVTSAVNGFVELVAGQVTYTSLSEFVGTDQFFYTMQDDRGAMSSGRATLTIEASPEQPPVAIEDLYALQSGDEDRNTLYGSDGRDLLNALEANDEILAGAGDDLLRGGAGDDVLNGEAGIDTADYSDAIDGVEVYLNASLSRGAAGRDNLIDIENLRGSGFDDRLIGDAGDNVLTGDAGNDILKGKGGDDHFDGGAGDDRMRGAEGVDVMIGGAGSDIMFGLSGEDDLTGDEGRDFLYGGRDNDVVRGGAGDDELRGNLGNDQLDGGAGIDDLRGGGGNDALHGCADNDYLFGENGKDTLHGGAGDDVLTGGAGSGVLDGQRDVFMFASSALGSGGFDRLKDFEDGIDMIDLTSFGFTDVAQVQALASDRTTGLRLDFGSGDILFIEGWFLAELGATDVMLG